jgi:hypothetical protein
VIAPSELRRLAIVAVNRNSPLTSLVSKTISGGWAWLLRWVLILIQQRVMPDVAKQLAIASTK